MHIVYVCADAGVPVLGTKGASLHVQEVVRVMGRNHHVTVIAARTGGGGSLRVPDGCVLTLPEVTGRDPAQREQAARLAAAAVPELITAAERASGPADLVYERYSLWSSGGMAAAAARGVPGVLEVNAPLIDEQARHRYLGDPAAAEQVAATVFTDASAVVAVSEPVAAWVRQRAPHRSRVHVVPNGVDPSRFHPRPPRARGPFTVGFVGTLKPWHGVDVLVDAMRRMDGDARLVVVGDGPQLEQLREAAQPLASRAVFTGALPPAAVADALAQVDATAAPYPPGEAYFSPLKVFEYMAAGTAVVASAIGQLPSLIEDGRTGLLVPPGDPEALARALLRLRTNPALRRSLGEAARRDVCERHTWDQVVERILGLAGLEPRVVNLVADEARVMR